jgi:hypothetical protein
VLVSWRSAAENDWISTLRQALVPDGPAPEATADAPDPFRHAGREDTTVVLAAAAYHDIVMHPLDPPVYLGRDTASAFSALAPLFA